MSRIFDAGLVRAFDLQTRAVWFKREGVHTWLRVKRSLFPLAVDLPHHVLTPACFIFWVSL